MSTARAAATLILLAPLVLSACATKPVVAIDSVQVVAQPDANGNSPVAVDVVLVTQAGLGDQLTKLGADEWFKRRDQMRRDYPDGLQVLSWELVPGQTTQVTVGKSANDAVVYARYATPGDHRARVVQAGGEIQVLLQANDFVIEGGGTAVRH